MHGTSSTTLLLQWASHTMVYGTRMTTNLLVNPSARQRICTGVTLMHNDMHAKAHPHPSASLATIFLLNRLADTDRHNTDPQSLSPHTHQLLPQLHRPSSSSRPVEDLPRNLVPGFNRDTEITSHFVVSHTLFTLDHASLLSFPPLFLLI